MSASQEDRFDLILRANPRRGCRDGTCPDHTRRGARFFPPDGDQWPGAWMEGPEGCNGATALVRTGVAFPRWLRRLAATEDVDPGSASPGRPKTGIV